MASASGQKLIIETPELIPLEFTLAGVGSRFLALAIDTIIQIVLVVLLLIPLAAILGSGLVADESGWLGAVFILAAFTVQYCYFAIFETAWNGQTPGKRRLGLRVVRDTGVQISLHEALARNLLRLVDQFPGLYAVGIVSALLSPQSKRLGDYVAGTVVVHEAPFEEWHPTRERAAEEGPLGAPAARGVSPGELELIESFLERRDQLEAGVREQMMRRIVDHVAREQGISPGAVERPEEWLEETARAGRRMAHYR